MTTVYIGIGSNLGSREANCKKAINLLEEMGIKVLKLSSLIETEPWGVKEQPRFINMAIEAETALEPEDLLNILKTVEAETGRRPGTHWGPRDIDLDILFYGSMVIKTDRLEIPHPGIAERDFVLKPLAEIAPDKVHPVLQKSVKVLLAELSK